jgi:hypothetical protein
MPAPAAPLAQRLEGVSHFLWGEGASRQDGYSLRYTATLGLSAMDL